MRCLRSLQAGALELESAELRFETSAEGKAEVHSKETVPMMATVAEMMIFANAAVAEQLMKAFPGQALLRRHQPPKLDAFTEVRSHFDLGKASKILRTSPHPRLWSCKAVYNFFSILHRLYGLAGNACSLGRPEHKCKAGQISLPLAALQCFVPRHAGLCLSMPSTQTASLVVFNLVVPVVEQSSKPKHPGPQMRDQTQWAFGYSSQEQCLIPVTLQIADLCEKGGAALDVSTSSRLSRSLEAAVRAAPDTATAALIKSLATRAMSEAEYLSTGENATGKSHSLQS